MQATYPQVLIHRVIKALQFSEKMVEYYQQDLLDKKTFQYLDLAKKKPFFLTQAARVYPYRACFRRT